MVVSSSPSTDFSFEAQELSSLLLNASSSSSDILNSCRVMESFIDRHSWDQTRHFYITCFPVLLRKIFGFEKVLQPSGIDRWIAQTSEHSMNAVVNLLSPPGALFSSIFAADEENVVRYVFPSERLPAWIRHMLQLERGLYILSKVCPALFKDRLKEDGHGGGFQVLSVLVSSKELLCLIRSIDSTYNDVKSGSAPCCFDSLHKVVPAIREQLQDWEGDLSNFEKGSEITHSPSQKETPMLQLFSTSDSGGHQMLNNAIGNDCQDDDPNYVQHISGDDEDDGDEGGDDDDSCGVGDDVDHSNEDGQDDHEDDLGGGS